MTTQESTLLNQFSRTDASETPIRETEISAVDLIVVLLRHKKMIGAVTASTTLIALAAILMWQRSYVSTATILPPQQSQSSISSLVAGTMGGLAASTMGSQLGLKNPADLYTGILKSRTIADEVIAQFHLQQVYGKKLLSSTRKTLSAQATFASSKESLITISVKDRDAGRAAGIANAFIDALYRANARLALTGASQKRLFFEQQLKHEKDDLAQAEVDLKSLQQSSGLVVPSGQAEVLIRSSAQLRAEIASRQVQLQAMHSYATDENPQVQTLKREITALQAQLTQVETHGSPDSSLEISGSRLPQASLDYIRRLREVKYHETLFELLAKQYESARLDEAKEAPMIQVIDRAIVADKPSNPSWTLLLAAGIGGGLILGCLGALGYEVFIRVRGLVRAAKLQRTDPTHQAT